MGYFSNGSEGEFYRAQYCDRCVHDRGGEGPGCPVWGMHLMDNYKQNRTNGEGMEIKGRLEMFIPSDEHGGNKQCVMFLEDAERVPTKADAARSYEEHSRMQRHLEGK